MSRWELIREWRTDLDAKQVVVELYDTNERRHGSHHHLLGYRLTHDGAVIFEGGDIGVPPTTTIDGDETLATVLGFLSLQPGDTDPEHFEDYTPEQSAWVQQHGEELSIRAIQIRSGHATTTEQVRDSHGYPFRAVCTCGWTSAGYAARHAAQTMAADHEEQA